MNYFESQNYAPRARPRPQLPATRAPWAVLFGLIAAVLAGALAATQFPVFAGAAALLAAAAGAIFLLRHPAALLWLLIFSAPFNEYLALNAGGLNIRPYTLLSMLGILLIVWLAMTREKSRIREIAAHYKGMIAIVFLLLVSKLVTVYTLGVMPPYMTSMFCIKLILFAGLQFAAAFVVASCIETPERLHQVIRAWIHLSNLVCFIAFIQLLLANTMGLESYVWHREIISIGRPYSVFREPDVLGCYYAAVVVLLIPLLVANVRFVARPYLVLSLMAHAFFLMLIVVRAAWIATFLCMGLYVALMFMARRYNSVMPYLNGLLLAVLLFIMGLAMAAPSTAEKIIARFASVSNPNAESGAAYRIMELQTQFNMAAHPSQNTGGPMTVLLGYGDFSWSYWAPYVIPEDDFDQTAKTLAKGEVNVNPGFNMLLTVQFDNGLIGLALYAAFLIAVTSNFLKTLRRTRDPERQALLLATFLPVAATLICYQFSYDPLFLTLWILLGIHLAAAYHVDRAESGVDEIGVPVPA